MNERAAIDALLGHIYTSTFEYTALLVGQITCIIICVYIVKRTSYKYVGLYINDAFGGKITKLHLCSNAEIFMYIRDEYSWAHTHSNVRHYTRIHHLMSITINVHHVSNYKLVAVTIFA